VLNVGFTTGDTQKKENLKAERSKKKLGEKEGKNKLIKLRGEGKQFLPEAGRATLHGGKK